MSANISGTVLVTGTSGQVGSALLKLLRETEPSVRLATPSRAEMDLGDASSIRRYVQATAPRWIVSSAAYTAVDAAESDRDAAFAANAIAPGILAEEAVALGAGLIHLSTDYVFNGSGTKPWVETDQTAPLNVYGASKLAGEEAIARSGAAHAILRTSWVYSDGGKNFVRTMLRLLSTKTDPLRVVGDQHGSPTAAADLATAILAILRVAEQTSGGLADFSGVYHCAGTGETTWAGLAGAVREYLRVNMGGSQPEIIPVPTSEYPTPAARPLNSRLNCSKLAETFGIRMPHWSESVETVVRTLAATDLTPAPR